jgi:hypothetical protein
MVFVGNLEQCAVDFIAMMYFGVGTEIDSVRCCDDEGFMLIPLLAEEMPSVLEKTSKKIWWLEKSFVSLRY